jgi:hypothetical protein
VTERFQRRALLLPAVTSPLILLYRGQIFNTREAKDLLLDDVIGNVPNDDVNLRRLTRDNQNLMNLVYGNMEPS